MDLVALFLELRVHRYQKLRTTTLSVNRSMDKKTTKAIHNAIQEGEGTLDHYSWLIRCCIFSFMVWYAFMIVCSLITISVVSAFGRLTRDAIVVESVSTMILRRVA